jgi:DNA polymerase III alpha subunit (gram-positive type)
LNLLFLDTETTGLDHEENQLVEAAWATLENPEPKSIVLPHVPGLISDEVAELNGYYKRGMDKRENWAGPKELLEFHNAIKNVVLVGANPSFDELFLSSYFGYNPTNRPWHYRKLDIGSIAHGVLKPTPEKILGLSDIGKKLTERGFDIPNADHTAAGDVRALIAIYKVLVNYEGN